MTGVRFSGNVEILMSVFWKLFEKKREKGIYIFSGSDCVADGAAAVRETSVDRLIEEDDRSI